MSNQIDTTLAELMKNNPDLAARNPEVASIDPPGEPKRSKYGNKRTLYNGMVYDSQREASRAVELDLLRRAGEVICWQHHVVFPLSKGVSYEADFVVVYPDLHVEVEDTKGFRTHEYKIKAKLFREKYGQEIKEL
ncbi:MAG: DUF1064 domain-containing protein [Dehalococcoidia bacterium]